MSVAGKHGSEPLLALRGIHKHFGAVRALKGVTFELHAGEVHALLGENGAGKSTLIKVITGAHTPDDGEILLEGRSLTDLTPAKAHTLGIACIYQQPSLFPDLTIAENMGLVLDSPKGLRILSWKKRRSQARELLDRVGSNLNPETEVRNLSMPEQQLVEIAKALGTGARILIMDEPTASLTERETELLMSVIQNLRRSGVGIVYISHRLPEIFQIADRVTVLRDGETVGTLGVKGRGGNLPGEDTDIVLSDERQLIELMVGREMSHIYPPRNPHPGEVLLRVESLGSQVMGVQNIHFELRAGEILGLAGLVGAGRTELARMLFGICPADSGSIHMGTVGSGPALSIRQPADAIRHGIAYVPEDRRRHGVILEMSLVENTSLAVLSRLFPSGWMTDGKERTLTQDMIRQLGVKTSGPDAPGQSLSGGNQQKIALARWLATQPRVLILDEPTQGVDVGAKSEIHHWIRRLAADGMGVLLISSDLPEVLGMSDRVGVMRQGRWVATFPGGSTPGDVMAAALGHSKEEPRV